MYSIPDEFAERLQNEFDGRLRVRWSPIESSFVLEQKISRGIANAMPRHGDTEHDDYIRTRDGYLKIMSIRNGDRMPCGTCGATLRVPIFETAQVNCEYCQKKGYPYQYFAGYFELNDRFLEHLRSLDPLKGGSRRGRNRVEKVNSSLERGLDRAHYNVLDDAVSDNFTSIAGIPSVGYTGKVFPGTET
jgi:hypothetical protein